jgi:transposase
MRYLLADKGYDADRLRRLLRDASAVPVVPGRRRKRAICYDRERYRGRRLIENASAASRTSAASTPATTNPQASPLPPL